MLTAFSAIADLFNTHLNQTRESELLSDEWLRLERANGPTVKLLEDRLLSTLRSDTLTHERCVALGMDPRNLILPILGDFKLQLAYRPFKVLAPH